jgi:hypothetical protein
MCRMLFTSGCGRGKELVCGRSGGGREGVKGLEGRGLFQREMQGKRNSG